MERVYPELYVIAAWRIGRGLYSAWVSRRAAADVATTIFVDAEAAIASAANSGVATRGMLEAVAKLPGSPEQKAKALAQLAAQIHSKFPSWNFSAIQSTLPGSFAFRGTTHLAVITAEGAVYSGPIATGSVRAMQMHANGAITPVLELLKRY